MIHTSTSRTARRAFATLSSMAAVAALLAAPGSPANASASDEAGLAPISTDGHREALPKLRGVVGPGYDITIRPKNVPAGTYRLVVDDRSDDHNFHITGDGVDKKTGVDEVATKTWRITVTEGVYRIVCDPHAGIMRTKLTVTS